MRYSPAKFWLNSQILPGYLSQFIKEDAPLENRALTDQSAVSGGAISVVGFFGGNSLENTKKHMPATIRPGMID